MSKLEGLLFAVALAVLAFLAGGALVGMELFPHDLLRNAKSTGESVYAALFRQTWGVNYIRMSDVDRGALPAARLPGPERGVAGRLLAAGGPDQFLEACPEQGCIAAEIDADGNIVHGYPYRPAAILERNSTPEYEYEYVRFDPLVDIRPWGFERYANGDLLVVFHKSLAGNLFPYGAGVARVDRDGQPVWFRRDYSHHWPKLLPDGRALVPAVRLGPGELRLRYPTLQINLDCGRDKRYYDVVRVLGPDGKMEREIDLLLGLVDSPFRSVLQQSSQVCDIIHLNYVDVVGDDAAGLLPGLAPGDLVVSLRNISSVGILSPQGDFKRLVRGTFFQQHSAHHLSGTRLLLFDNLGSDAAAGPSRLLEIDLANGRERTVFPTAETPEELRRLISARAGDIRISADRARALVSYTHAGVGLEIRLSDGAVLARYDHLHDVSTVDEYPAKRRDKLARFRLYNLMYAE